MTIDYVPNPGKLLTIKEYSDQNGQLFQLNNMKGTKILLFVSMHCVRCIELLPPLSSPHIINFSYIGKGITSAILIGILAKQGIVVSSQSACSSKAKASRVLMAITNDEMISSSSIRLSLHESVSLKDAEYLLDSIEKMVNHVKTKNKFELLQGV